MIQSPYNLLFFFLSFLSLEKLVRTFSKLSLNLFNQKRKEEEEESEADKGNKHTQTESRRRA